MDKCKHKNLQTEILTGYFVNHFPLLPNSSEEVLFDVAEEQHCTASLQPSMQIDAKLQQFLLY